MYNVSSKVEVMSIDIMACPVILSLVYASRQPRMSKFPDKMLFEHLIVKSNSIHVMQFLF